VHHGRHLSLIVWVTTLGSVTTCRDFLPDCVMASERRKVYYVVAPDGLCDWFGERVAP
jgi:hypothetical protein